VEQGLSPSRIRNAHQVLSQILAAGVEGGRISRNPAAGVRLPRIVRRDMHFLTPARSRTWSPRSIRAMGCWCALPPIRGFAPASWWRCASGT
jgi:hypothetical protein